ALLTAGFLRDEEGVAEQFAALAAARRATRLPTLGVWAAAERLPEILAIHPGAAMSPAVAVPPSRAAREWPREEALVELLRGRMTIVGPTTAAALGRSLAVGAADCEGALLALESEGVVLRGTF